MDSLVGRAFPAGEPHEVTADELARFSAMFDGAGCWPTFAITLAAPAWQALFDDPSLGLELRRTVHADQTFDIVRPFAPGDVVVATASVVKDRLRGGTRTLGVQVDLDVAGERVATSTSTLLVEVDR